MQIALKQNLQRGLIGLGRVATTVGGASRRKRDGLLPPTSRPKFLAGLGDEVLEIGPFNAPALRGPKVAYFDLLDKAALQERAVEHDRDPDTCPDIDYVSPLGDLSVVDRKFAAVFSSHVIEHQPDLVAHLLGVQEILHAGGRYYLAVPDKRFCFDHFTALSTLAEVEAAHAERRQLHTEASIRAHWLHLTHNDALRHWLGRHGTAGSFNHSAENAEIDVKRAAAGDYVDVHAWRFTPSSFRDIFSRLHERGLTSMKPVAVHDTMFPHVEFFAILQRGR